jgi:hypothetical protein
MDLYIEVRDFISAYDCILLTPREEFKNKSKLINIKCGNCENGFIRSSFIDFVKRKYKMCKECSAFHNRIVRFENFKIFVAENSECSLVSTINDFNNNLSKLIVKCYCGNEFPTTHSMFIHSNKRQCNECGFKNKGQKIPYEEVREYINSRNYKLITSKDEYENASTLIEINCLCGNPFKNTFSQFKYGKGIRCDDCNRRETSERKTIPYSEIKHFVENESKSGCKLLTKEQDYVNTHTNVEIQCPCGERYFTNIHMFRSDNKRQCNICGLGYMKKDDFVNLFHDKEEVNGCELIDYEDTGEFIYARNKISIKCKCGEIFNTIRYSFTHNDKKRCDKCANIYYKGEERIREFLVNNNLNFKIQYCFENCRGTRKPLPFDFAVFDEKGSLDYLIEYDGRQHFEPVNFGGCSDEVALKEYENLKNNDRTKNEYCKSNHIKLIRIPYWDFDRIEEILTKELL